MRFLALLTIFFALPGCTAFVGYQITEPDSSVPARVIEAEDGTPHLLYATKQECVGVSITVSEGATPCGESAQLVEWMGEVLKSMVSFTGRILPAGFSEPDGD